MQKCSTNRILVLSIKVFLISPQTSFIIVLWPTSIFLLQLAIFMNFGHFVLRKAYFLLLNLAIFYSIFYLIKQFFNIIIWCFLIINCLQIQNHILMFQIIYPLAIISSFVMFYRIRFSLLSNNIIHLLCMYYWVNCWH